MTCMGWHQVFCVYIIASSLAFFMGILSVWMSGSWFLILWALFPLLVCLVQLWYDGFHCNLCNLCPMFYFKIKRISNTLQTIINKLFETQENPGKPRLFTSSLVAPLLKIYSKTCNVQALFTMASWNCMCT